VYVVPEKGRKTVVVVVVWYKSVTYFVTTSHILTAILMANGSNDVFLPL